MNHTLYAIYNIISEGVYVGKTSRGVRYRWYVHLSRLRNGTHHNPHLQASWNKYGKDAFVLVILRITETPEELNATEIAEIARLRSEGKKVYNLTNGGDGRTGDTISEVQRAKISAALRRYYANPENRQRLSEEHKRRYQDPGERAKQTEVIRRFQSDPAFKQRQSVATKRRWSHADERERQSQRMQKLWEKAETREKQHQALCDMHSDPDFHQRWRSSLKAAWQNPEAIEHKRQGNLKRYKDPAERAKTSAANRRRYEDPAERRKMSEANIRRYGYVYVITSPTGEKIETNNLREFCREHNLPFATMRRVVIGERLEYYGWKGYRYKGDNQD